VTNQAAFHETEMMRHFEAGRMASARWHCRIWTRLVAAQKFFNDGTEASGLLNSDQQARRHPIKSELRPADGASEGKP
jgi:hypothetical protein